MDRRGFLGSILAAAVAPAIVRADSLMRIVPQETLVLASTGYLAPASDAMWAGCIREMWAYCINDDTVLTRFDVLMDDRTQYHVDVKSPTIIGLRDQDREAALRVLKDHARGGRPLRGVLEIPDGIRGRYI